MHTDDSTCIQEAILWATKILHVDCKKINTSDVVSNYLYLLLDKQSKLKSLLYKYEILFHSTLDTWKIEVVNIKLKPGAQLYCHAPCQIPRIYKETLRNKVNWLVKLGVLKKYSDFK